MIQKLIVTPVVLGVLFFTSFALAASYSDIKEPRQDFKPAPRKTYTTRTPGSYAPRQSTSSTNLSDYNIKLDIGRIFRGDGYINVGLDLPWNENIVVGPTAGYLIKGSAGVSGFELGASGTYYYNHPRYTTGIIIFSQVDYAILKVGSLPFSNTLSLAAFGGYQYWVQDPNWNKLNFTAGIGLRYDSISFPEGSPQRTLNNALNALSSLTGSSTQETTGDSSFGPVFTILAGWRF